MIQSHIGLLSKSMKLTVRTGPMVKSSSLRLPARSFSFESRGVFDQFWKKENTFKATKTNLETGSNNRRFKGSFTKTDLVHKKHRLCRTLLSTARVCILITYPCNIINLTLEHRVKYYTHHLKRLIEIEI